MSSVGSKPVRIRADVAAQVADHASLEKRSFANMVEVLLLKALEGGAVLTERGAAARPLGEGTPLREGVADLPRSASSVPRAHMKLNRPAVECATRITAGVCPDCGREVKP